ncbi:histone acetyltransferase p300-like isoform X2 [Planococcus citri]|uniref:histone acetyltransferase p300-like isoform X2 n=1 Tax=Planococcus citri TaxID=170843 RepID=UPI0031F98516
MGNSMDSENTPPSSSDTQTNPEVSLELNDDCTSLSQEDQQLPPQEPEKQSIQSCLQSLVHACQCQSTTCQLSSCHRMKSVLLHAKACKLKVNGNCPICKQLIALCFYHSKCCQVAECPVLLCSNIKQKNIEQEQSQQRVQQAGLLPHCMNAMNSPTTPSSTESGVSSNSETSSAGSSGQKSSSSQAPSNDGLQFHQLLEQQLWEAIRSTRSKREKDKVLQILKTNPQLLAAFIKQKQQSNNPISSPTTALSPSSDETARQKPLYGPTELCRNMAAMTFTDSENKVPTCSSTEQETKQENPQLLIQHDEAQLDKSDEPSEFESSSASSIIHDIPQKVTKEWQKLINNEIRERLVKKLVGAIFPTSTAQAAAESGNGGSGAPNEAQNSPSNNLNRSRLNSHIDGRIVQNLEWHARKVECDIYEAANSKSEYYRLLAEKYYKIHQVLDELRQKRKEQPLQQQKQLDGEGTVPICSTIEQKSKQEKSQLRNPDT